MFVKTCSICNRISATDADHTDCVQQRRIEVEMDNTEVREGLAQRLGAQNDERDGLGVEIRAVLEHMAREKAQPDSGS